MTYKTSVTNTMNCDCGGIIAKSIKMSKEVSNKIENAKFSAGDVVYLKSAKHPIELTKIQGKSETVYTPSIFTIPYMVVSEIFVDEKVGKTLFSTKDNTTEPQQIKNIGKYPIRVKCVWFYEGKLQEKVFWQDALELVENK